MKTFIFGSVPESTREELTFGLGFERCAHLSNRDGGKGMTVEREQHEQR